MHAERINIRQDNINIYIYIYLPIDTYNDLMMQEIKTLRNKDDR